MVVRSLLDVVGGPGPAPNSPLVASPGTRPGLGIDAIRPRVDDRCPPTDTGSHSTSFAPPWKEKGGGADHRPKIGRRSFPRGEAGNAEADSGIALDRLQHPPGAPAGRATRPTSRVETCIMYDERGLSCRGDCGPFLASPGRTSCPRGRSAWAASGVAKGCRRHPRDHGLRRCSLSPDKSTQGTGRDSSGGLARTPRTTAHRSAPHAGRWVGGVGLSTASRRLRNWVAVLRGE
jgi:hypothetical protein